MIEISADYQPFIPQLIPELGINYLKGRPFSEELAIEAANIIALGANVHFPIKASLVANMCRIPLITRREGMHYGMQGELLPLEGHGGLYSLIELKSSLDEPEARHTIAHETGHQVLRILDMPAYNYEGPYRIESFCDTFAATLLAPDHLLRYFQDRVGDNSMPYLELFRELLKETAIPPFVLAKRLVDTGIIPCTLATIYINNSYRQVDGQIGRRNNSGNCGWIYFNGKYGLGEDDIRENSVSRGLLSYFYDFGDSSLRLYGDNLRRIVNLGGAYAAGAIESNSLIPVFRVEAQAMVWALDKEVDCGIFLLEQGPKLAEVADLDYLDPKMFRKLWKTSDLGWK